jgi:prepilin peptidase CpaA
VLIVPWALSLALAACCLAAVTDLRARTIPNWLTLPLLLCGVLGHGLWWGFDGLWLSVLGCSICFVPGYFLFVRNALGGGDVKLFAGLGALLGPREGLELQLCAFALVALYALWSTAWHGRLGALLRSSCRATLHLLAPARFARPSGVEYESVELPMGVAILLSALAVALRSAL